MKAIVLCLTVLCVGAFGAPNDIDGRLIGGEEARRGEFPYMVSLNLCTEDYLGELCHHVCGGAIIDPEWVVTAAHCVIDGPEGRYEIVAGIHELVADNPDKQVRRVLRHHVHPDFPGANGPHAFDIVLLKLDEPLHFNRLVHEVELPIREFEYENDVLITGWGSLGPGPDDPDSHIMPNALHYVRTHVITEEQCHRDLDEILGGQPHPLDHFANICTGPSNGRYVICSGDSGDPVVDYSERRLIGIASWTITPCGVIDAPSVHTRISFFTPWIVEVLAQPEPEPEPGPGPEPEPEPEPEPGPGPEPEPEPEPEPGPGPEPELQSKFVPQYL